MPQYKWTRDEPFRDHMNDRLVERGDVVELLESVADPQPGFETVDEPETDEPDGYECGVNGCSRSVDAPDATCWQHDE